MTLHACFLVDRMQSIRQHNTSADLNVVLVGNKLDKEAERVISAEQGQAVATEFGEIEKLATCVIRQHT